MSTRSIGSPVDASLLRPANHRSVSVTSISGRARPAPFEQRGRNQTAYRGQADECALAVALPPRDDRSRRTQNLADRNRGLVVRPPHVDDRGSGPAESATRY